MAVVVVTGASAGVGREIALAWARRGASVALLARGRSRLEAVAAEVAAAGGHALMVPCDVADPDQVEAAADAVEAHFGAIDVWVNNAVVSIFAALEDLTPADIRRVTDVAYHGYVWGTVAALKRMRPRGRGAVVQVSSAVAFRGVPLQSAYSGAKAAVLGFTGAVRAELIAAGSPVAITLVHLPAIATPHYGWAANRTGGVARALDPVLAPREAAEAVVAAASSGRREVFVGGQTVQAVLANAVAPEILDHYLAWRCVDGAGLALAGGGGGGTGNLFTPSPDGPPVPTELAQPAPLQIGPPLGAAGEVLGKLLFRFLSGK